MRTVTTTIELSEAQYHAFRAEAARINAHNAQGAVWKTEDEIGIVAQSAVEHRANKILERYAQDAEAAFPADQGNVQISVTAAHEEVGDSKETINRSLPDDVQNEAISVADDVLDLFMRCVQAEAGNQPLEGRQAVADVILNRVADPRFPDTITDVIIADGQFTVVTTGAIDKAVPDDITSQAVAAELSGARVLPEGYVYFNTSPIGADVIHIKDHYFGR